MICPRFGIMVSSIIKLFDSNRFVIVLGYSIPNRPHSSCSQFFNYFIILIIKFKIISFLYARMCFFLGLTEIFRYFSPLVLLFFGWGRHIFFDISTLPNPLKRIRKFLSRHFGGSKSFPLYFRNDAFSPYWYFWWFLSLGFFILLFSPFFD